MRAGLLLLLAAVASAQPMRSGSPPLSYYELALLRNEAIRKELKLDADADKKAVAAAEGGGRLLSFSTGPKRQEAVKRIEAELAFL
ncbi:MAG: hypothetical protein K2W96_07165, partial [Gemmataceae bacterium]|nr:hypothetical protein [Gemmataceae bacterium]